MTESTTKSNGSLGCALLFSLPFLLMGLFALGLGLYEFTSRGEFTEDTISKLGAGAMFSLAGGGLMAAMLVGWRKEKELARLQALHPDMPWLWRADWAEGRVKSTTPAAMIAYWIFGILFVGLSAPILYNVDEILRKAPMSYLVFLFPLVGLAMLAAALYATVRWVKYGQTWCDLVSNPGVLGGWFRAVIWTRIDLVHEGTVETQLTCYHCYVTGSGKNRSAHRRVMWQEHRTITREHLAVEQDGTVAIPVRFYVPPSCTPTTPGSPTDRMEWELKATAKVSGVDFLAEFIVPVFLTEESSDTPPEDLESEGAVLGATAWQPTIRVMEGVNSLELHAPPRRNWGPVLGTTLFTAIISVVVAAMIYSGEVPKLFPVVFGFFNILLLWTALWMWFGHSRARFEHGMAHISHTVFGLGPRRTIALYDVIGLDAHVTMQSGSTAFYTIRIKTPSGKTKNLVGGLRNKSEAEDIIRRVEQFMATDFG